MPLFDYRCESCGEVFEILAGSSAAADEVVCPSCGSVGATRLFGCIALGGSRTSMNPQNFVRPNGPVTRPAPAGPAVKPGG
jgi:putative FmdB family regulatory protein